MMFAIFFINFLQHFDYIQNMFQNHFQSDDPSTINISETSNAQQTSFKLQCNSVLIFIVLGFVFLIMAMIELITNYQDVEHNLPLNYDKTNNKVISNPFYVTYLTDESVFLYFDFEKLTQFSFTNKFDGENIEFFDDYASNCNSFKLNSQTLKTNSILNQTLNPYSFSIPCGMYPSMFLGTNINLILDNGTKLQIDFSGTSVFRYNVQNLNTSLQWTSLEHPLFQSWMEQNAILNTHKFIGKINGRFEGNVHLQIQQVNGFPKDIGPMSVFMTNNKALGGFNMFFCFSNFAQSGLMFAFAFLVYIYQKIMKDQVKNAVNVGERKIQLRANYETQAGKINF